MHCVKSDAKILKLRNNFQLFTPHRSIEAAQETQY